MAIPSKGIGWETESNLLWQIAKQLERLTQVTASFSPSLQQTLDQVLTNGNTSLLDAKIGELGLWQPEIDNGDGTFGSYGNISLYIGDTNTISVVEIRGAGFETPVLLSSSDDGVVSFKYAHHNPTFNFNGITQTRVWKWQDVDGTVALIQGKIKLSDPNQSHFNDLASANAYVSGFTSATITDESYNIVTHTYSFTVPAGSDFNNSDNFCNDNQMNFQDPEGLVISFGNGCFLENATDNIFGNITAGNNFLIASTGKNKMNIINVGNYAFSKASPSIKNTIYKIEGCGNEFASNYTGRMDVGLFGNDGGQNLPTDIFATSNLAWINTPYSNKFINRGAEDADIARARDNMTNANKEIFFN